MKFLISTSCRGTGRSAILKLDVENCNLQLFREDDYYEPGNPRMDYIYWGMDIYERKLYCAGGNVLSILDLDGRVLLRKEEDSLDIVHDLKAIDGRILCTNTGYDTVDVFSTDFTHLESICVKDLSCFHSRNLVPKTVENPDSLHLNFISERDGTVFLTHSFASVRDRLLAMKVAIDQPLSMESLRARWVYALIRKFRHGRVLDAGGVFTLNGVEVVRGIHGAHDGVFFGDKFYVNSTYNIETLVYDKDFRLEKRIPFRIGMILRGLCPIDEATLLLGTTRVDPERSASEIYGKVLRGRGSTTFDDYSSIKVVDIRTGDILETIPLQPYQGIHPEIYKIIPLTQ